MDSIVSAALEEICARGAGGIALPELWPGLRAALASSGLPACDAVKKALWTRLLAIPGVRFEAHGAPVGPQDPSVQSLEDSERLGLRVVAEERLRDSFVGLYDLKLSNPIQRRALERLAAARADGITQNELAKEFGIKGNNIFYIVKNLECQQLIVRQSTIVREKESGMDGENGLKNTSIVNTNLIHLYRYAKNMGLNSQQRIEITRPNLLETLGCADGSSLTGDGASTECVKEDVCVKDYLPAMKAVCDKLEEASGKVLVVSDIKLALGYRKTPGHRAWRNILSKLKDASLVEEFPAKVNNKVVNCLRLQKKFDPKDFNLKTITCGYDGFDTEHIVKHGKRGQITDQFLELPIDHCIYDIVDGEGPKGITITEVCKRLGFNAKRIYTRIIGMCSRFGMHVQAEIHNRTPLYRVWTFKNYQHYSTNMFPGNCELTPDRNGISTQSKDLISYDQSSLNIQVSDSCSTDDILHYKKTHSGQIGLETPSISLRHNGDAQVILSCTAPESLASEFTNFDGLKVGSAGRVTESTAVSSEGPHPISSTSPKDQSLHRYQNLGSTVVGTQREQRILERLKNEKFILTVELYRWLEGLERNKPTTMARKTLNRTLNKLQQEGLCKLIPVTIPVVTNFSRTRVTEVILHPSVGTLSSELLDQIYKRQRLFDIQSRGGSARSKNDQPVTVLTGVKQSSSRVDDKPVILEAMRSNGYVSAKMVRVKLLHNFLWGYLSSLPDWCTALNSKEHGYDLNNPPSTRHLFTLGAAIKAMPLELFLQVVGSAKAIDGMAEHCSLRSRLLDLPLHEYKSLMDTHATARLSSIIDILLRLKLIQLVRKGLPDDKNVLPHTVLTHAMELRPYIEEPLLRALPCSNVNARDLRPRVRHDFLLSKKDAVDAYWETLEYCYAVADPAAASHAFPGSAVHEVFLSRSWTSVRVLTDEQRMELLKRVTNDFPKKISFKDCVKIAKELNLTVEQVLRVYYDKRQSRLHTYPISSEHKNQENRMDANNNKSFARKRKRERSLKHSQADTGTRESSRPMSITLDTDETHIGRTTGALDSTENCDSHLQVYVNESQVNAAVESERHEENDDNCAFISQYAVSRLKSVRRKKFSWTDNSDRQLVMQYARYRAMRGAGNQRVDWTSLSALPAPPNTCQRRMALLRSNTNISSALMRLCNLLGERYDRYRDRTRRMQEKEFLSRNDSGHSIRDVISVGRFAQNLSATQENASDLDSQLCHWDDFEDPSIKMAVDEVLRYKRMAKLEPANRAGPGREKEWSNISPTDGTNSDAQEFVTLKEQDKVSMDPGHGTPSHVEGCHKNGNNFSITGRRRSSYHPRKKFFKLLNKRGISIKRHVCESLTVANAIELLKLVFLSTSSEPKVQTSLATILQQYSECDLFAAFSYLREKNFMVTGHGSRPFVLSQKFWNNASSSPFPVDSGKRAANFSTWLYKQEKELMEHGLNLTSDLQCGEIFHLFALVSSGEFLISPCLPKEGIGEADEPRSSKSFLPMEDIGEADELKRLKRKREKGKLSSGEKVKKHKPLGKVDTHFCSRREKGFPGIKVLLNRATISRDDAVLSLTDKDNYTCSLSYEEKSEGSSYSTVKTIGFPSLQGKLNSRCKSGNNSEPAKSQNELPWEAMTSYATLLSSRFIGMNEVVTYTPELLKSVQSTIHQAGEQGLNMEEISETLEIQGVQSAKIIVDTLEVFQLAIKVNAYDSVRVVDSLYKPKYFISTLADHNQEHDLASYMKSRVASYEVPLQVSREKHDSVHDSQKDISMSLSDGHMVTILDLPKEPVLTQIEFQPIGVDVASEQCMQLEVVPVQGNDGNSKYPVTGVPHARQPILPWINGDGCTNTIVYKGLTRRVFGTVMQNPGLLEEDIIRRMDVLNPQTCRHLLESMILDSHITVRTMRQTTTATPPPTLQDLFRSGFKKPESVLRKHYFANPMSTCLL